MKKAFLYRIYPTPEQELLLRHTWGCVRLVYNKALHERQERVGYPETSSLLTQWKKEEELDFLNNDVSSVPLQQGLRHLQTAFVNFFAVSLHASRGWHISIRFDEPTIQPLTVSEDAVGIDLGITSLIATSKGNKIANPKHFKKHCKRLKKAQKNFSRKQKGSKNRERARIKVAKIHLKISDSRKDFLHKTTTQLLRENQTIAVELLAVKNRVKNPKLALVISDSGWSELSR